MMDKMTAGLVKAVALVILENLPQLNAAGFVSWDALNAARTQVLATLTDAERPEDRALLSELLLRLG